MAGGDLGVVMLASDRVGALFGGFLRVQVASTVIRKKHTV